MREIKLRAWDKDKEWMVCNVQDAYDGLPYSKENAEHIVDSYDWVSGFSSFLDSDDFIPMQYTGLKDKNGVEIYEGDIVRWINSDGESVHSVVEFVDGAFRVHNVCFTLWDYLDNDAEVIGNSYDNPELMEGERDVDFN